MCKAFTDAIPGRSHRRAHCGRTGGNRLALRTPHCGVAHRQRWWPLTAQSVSGRFVTGFIHVCIAWSALCNLTLTAAPRVVLSGSWCGPCSRSVCVAVSSAAHSVYNAYSVGTAMRMLAMLGPAAAHALRDGGARERNSDPRPQAFHLVRAPYCVIRAPAPYIRTPLPEYVPLFPNPYHSSLDTYHYPRIRTILS
jgi:hypothetical protein